MSKISKLNKEEIAVKEILETLRPAMEADGGGIDLVSVQNGIVNIKFKGACLLCPSIVMTLKLGIAKTLKEKLLWIKDVHRI